jgi:hypothetical protein
VAQANSPGTETAFSLAKWQITHSGSAPLGEGLCTATLEVSESPVEARASIEPARPRAFRLAFHGGLDAESLAHYELNRELLSGEDAFREGFVSVDRLNGEYAFTLIPVDGGGYRVRALRRADGNLASEFMLERQF